MPCAGPAHFNVGVTAEEASDLSGECNIWRPLIGPSDQRDQRFQSDHMMGEENGNAENM